MNAKERHPAGPTVHVFVNGEVRLVPVGCTVAGLVAAIGFVPVQVAVERNQQIVPRKDHATSVLADGDRLEIVTLFGGG